MRADGKYKNFKGIEIDGKTVDSKNYTAWSGSTYVKFKKRFCKYIIWRKAYRKIHIYRWLCDHQSDDCKEGNSDTKNPSDNKKPDTNTNTSGNGTNNTTTTANTQVKAPKTGDTFQPILWAGILCVSVAGMAGVVAADKKRKKCQQEVKIRSINIKSSQETQTEPHSQKEVDGAQSFIADHRGGEGSI